MLKLIIILYIWSAKDGKALSLRRIERQAKR